jgi:hypothetical protein
MLAGVCGVSTDMVGYGVHRVCIPQVSPSGVSQYFSAYVNSLISHLNRKKGIASFVLAPIVSSSS